jgi:hypothetical protein
MAHAARSCRPNAVVSFKGQKLVVRALGHIAAGEEVTIAYVELYQPTQYRRLQANPLLLLSYLHIRARVWQGSSTCVKGRRRRRLALPLPLPLACGFTRLAFLCG